MGSNILSELLSLVSGRLAAARPRHRKEGGGHPVLVFLILTASLSCAISGRAAQTAGADGVGKIAVATRAPGAIEIDGLLNETHWQATPVVDDIVQREPVEGAPATERTEVRLLFDDSNLYIGVVSYDSEPNRIVATQMSRDADLSVDDQIEILLDTFHDHRNAFYFATNPNGALVDGLIIENGEINREWDAIWDVRVRRIEVGWSAEFAIPFKSLSFNTNDLSWGFNFSRTIRRKIEEDRWAAPRLDVQFVQVSEAGELEGLSGTEQGRGLDVRPYLSGNLNSQPGPGGTSARGDAGGDVFYSVTPNLKLTGTLYTDFAETEVDDRQINLTRFPLFFPEKRSFFLENAAVFDFRTGGAGLGGPGELIPFFSRRIGLLGGDEVPILGGLKLAGKAGPYDVGVLDVRTRDSAVAAARNFFVGRIKRNIGSQSYVGAIFTEGNPAAPESARTYGADLQLATSNFLGGQRNFSFRAFGLGVDNDGVEGETTAYGFGASYPNDLWDLQADWRRVGRNFEPALGFSPRNDVSQVNLSVNFAPRPTGFLGIRRMLHQFSFRRFVRLEYGQVESWQMFTAPVNYTWNSGDRFELNWVGIFERLFEPFEISDGVILPPGDYRFNRYRVEIFTSNNRPWKIDATWWFGTYWSGRSDEASGQFQYKWAPHLDTSLGYNQTFARLPEGNFVARIFSLRTNYSFSPTLTLFNLVQFDSESNNLGLQSRVRWILRPGREVFFVFNQGWTRTVDQTGARVFETAETAAAVKVQYTVRF